MTETRLPNDEIAAGTIRFVSPSAHRQNSVPRPRAGFTLLELVVVAGLLVVLASIVVPSVTGMGRRGLLMTASGDVLRFLADNRRKAVDQGTRRWVRFEVDGKALVAGADGGAVDAQFSLPEGCEFGSHDSPERLPDDVADSVGVEQRQAAWSPEISFYPDGTASDQRWTLKGAGSRRLVSIRGLTGRVRVSLGSDDDEDG